MTPYYDEDGITIYHADCADVLSTIDPSMVDLVLTDPPYGIALAADYATSLPSSGFKGSPPPRTFADIEGDDMPFDPSALLEFGRCVMFGANHYFGSLPRWPDRVGQDRRGKNLHDAVRC